VALGGVLRAEVAAGRGSRPGSYLAIAALWSLRRRSCLRQAERIFILALCVSRMSTYTWDDIERPILEAFREAEVDGTDRMARAAAATPDISSERRMDSVIALQEAGYVEAQVSQDAGGSKWLMSVGSLTEKGRRAVGQWPSDDAVAALFDLLDRQVESAPDDETRSRWQQVRDAMTSVGTGATGAFVAQYLGVLAHLPH
jgi:hypothetical protein